ncbi:hypothetical protein AAE478_005038 [Parahypoxylon ruwenzoriense]
MALAIRGVTELFRFVNREKEVNGQILAFSISPDNGSVRMYGHYPVIDGKDIKYYRHLIRRFDFMELNSKERWTAYRFIKNVYDIRMRKYIERMCSAIDQLLLKIGDGALAFSGSAALPQNLGRRHRASEAGSGTLLEGGQPRSAC